MRLRPQRAGRGACFRPRLAGRGICSAPWPAGRRTSGQARAGVNGTGRKLRGKHESRIARGICTCSHTFVCNVRGRVTLCLPPTAILPRAVGPDPLRMWVRPHRAPARRRAAVAITGISAYSAGFEIFVTARFRPGAGSASGSGDRGPGGPEPAPPRRSFRLGMQFANGTRVIGQHGGSRLSGDDEPAGPILRTFLGGGGPRSSFWRWWAWPLPPPGPMEFVCEWPALGTRTSTRTGT
jgi:hypothetical protein